jgi:hypothetical protein
MRLGRVSEALAGRLDASPAAPSRSGAGEAELSPS